MSASTERKNRQTAREAGTDRKILAAQEEAKKKAKSRTRWTIGTIIVAIIVAGSIFLNTGFMYHNSTAVSVGEKKYSPAEMQYYVGSHFYQFASQYGNYSSVFGLDTSYGVSGLASQPCSMLSEGGSWLDYFVSEAKSQLVQQKALVDYAKENGIALDADELALIDESMDTLAEYAKQTNFSTLNKFLAGNYGEGVNEKVARTCEEEQMLANKVYSTIYEGLEFTDAELKEYYAGLNGASDLFTYASYTVKAETVETTDEAGEVTSAPNDETMAAAKKTADAIVAGYKNGVAVPASELDVPAAAETPAMALVHAQIENEYVFRLNAAVAAEIEGESANVSGNVAGNSLYSAFSEWMHGNVKPGDCTVVETTNGYMVVVFIDRNANDYKPVSVRHILIEAEPAEDGTFTEEALEKAYAETEALYNEWLAGDATEESFAALANEHSSDAGSNTNGGLYEGIAKGSTVQQFNDFCFGGHKPGDTAIVYGTNGSYAGFHIIYFVSEDEMTADLQIAKSALADNAMTDWLTEHTAGYEAVNHTWLKLVG